MKHQPKVVDTPVYSWDLGPFCEPKEVKKVIQEKVPECVACGIKAASVQALLAAGDCPGRSGSSSHKERLT